MIEAHWWFVAAFATFAYGTTRYTLDLFRPPQPPPETIKAILDDWRAESP